MPVSEKDRKFMEKIARYFRDTKTEENPDGSIRDTALYFGLNRNKIRKILVTMGEITLPITEDVVKLREEGRSIKEIAAILDVSTATVSTALPYEDKVDNTLEPTAHAAQVREYRAYERKQAGRQVSKKKLPEKNLSKKESAMGMPEKEWQKDIRMSYKETYHRPRRITWADIPENEWNEDLSILDDDTEEMKAFKKELSGLIDEQAQAYLEMKELESKKEMGEEEKEHLNRLHHEFGYYPGALNNRPSSELSAISGERMPPFPHAVFRLHLELVNEYPDKDTTDAIRRWGNVACGDTISRDIVVPCDIPLYAMHYMIQRAFGWQNSHLHKFYLSEERNREIIGDSADVWTDLVGVLYRSPLMDEYAEFWADDYETGSFKLWLRKKYTGPYVSQCKEEGIIACRRDMDELDPDEEYYLRYEKVFDYQTRQFTEEEQLTGVFAVMDWEGKYREQPKPFHEDVPYRIEIRKFSQLPSDALKYVFERDPFALLERLPLHTVLACGKDCLSDDPSEAKDISDRMIPPGRDMRRIYGKQAAEILKDKVDHPLAQVLPFPFTKELYYLYDFGDHWEVRITASENCPDLVESGRITQTELDRANTKCRETYRPVLIARDGEMVMDDVGGLHGFADFLRITHPDLKEMNPDEKAMAKQEKKEYLEWAKGMGWKKDNVKDFNLL